MYCITYNIIVLIIMTNLIFSQNWEPYHMYDKAKHYNTIIDFEAIDQQAQLMTIESDDRDILTHEIIGYLPYWEYAIYPVLQEISAYFWRMKSGSD